MAKTKTKKEKIVDLKSKAEKITEEQLTKVQDLINQINRSQMELGQMETRKHAMLHNISLLQESVGSMRDEFEKEYGTADINVQDGTINYPKENGEVNKED
tara:strand:- start:526 stop:828 length:303 start_codon:yes stop_codon:yes gene_type:complete